MRALLRRIVVGTLLISAVVSCTLLPPIALSLLVLFWIFLASNEFTTLLQRMNVPLPRLILPLVNLLFPVSVLADLALRGAPPSHIHLGELLLPCAVIAGYAIVTQPPRAARLSYAVFGIFYLSLLPAHLIMLRFLPGVSVRLVLFPLLATWLNDTAAYAFGRWLGRHQLSAISPKKTWEGFVAGVLTTVVFAVFYLRWAMPEAAPLLTGILGLTLGMAAQAGDLVESIFKREAGVKDSSAALSEHGGFLDRADSLLFTIPVFYYYYLFLL